MQYISLEINLSGKIQLGWDLYSRHWITSPYTANWATETTPGDSEDFHHMRLSDAPLDTARDSDFSTFNLVLSLIT